MSIHFTCLAYVNGFVCRFIIFKSRKFSEIRICLSSGFVMDKIMLPFSFLVCWFIFLMSFGWLLREIFGYSTDVFRYFVLIPRLVE